MKIIKIKTALFAFLISVTISAQAQTNEIDSLRNRAKMESMLLKLSFQNYLNEIESYNDDSLAVCLTQLRNHFPYLKHRIESVSELKDLIKSRDRRDYYAASLSKYILEYYELRIGILILETK